MLIYALICLSLSLAGVAGLQFFYMIYLDRIGKEQKKRIRELEKHSRKISLLLREADKQIIKQEKFINSVTEEFGDEDEELWADVIGEH